MVSDGFFTLTKQTAVCVKKSAHRDKRAPVFTVHDKESIFYAKIVEITVL